MPTTIAPAYGLVTKGITPFNLVMHLLFFSDVDAWWRRRNVVTRWMAKRTFMARFAMIRFEGRVNRPFTHGTTDGGGAFVVHGVRHAYHDRFQLEGKHVILRTQDGTPAVTMNYFVNDLDILRGTGQFDMNYAQDF